MRDRPAWTARHDAKSLLPVEAIDLVNDPVDVVVEMRRALPQFRDGMQQLVDRAAKFAQRIGLKTAGRKPFDHAGLRFSRHLAHLAPGIGEEAKRPRRRDRRVELAQRAGRGVARIDVERLAGFSLFAIEVEKRLLGHVDFATHLGDRWNLAAGQAVRDVFQRFHVGGDVFTFAAVAARRAGDQFALLVAQRYRQPVDLRLGGKDNDLVLGKAQKPPDRHG